jgi:hypothetical protein
MLSLILILILGLFSHTFPEPPTTKCEISRVFTSVELDRDALVMTRHGSVSAADLLLTPTDMEIGEHKVVLTRRTTDLYRIVDSDIHIQTRRCFRSGHRMTATVTITDMSAWAKGQIIFD